MIYDIFDKAEAITICSIPLSRRGSEDKPIWGFTKDGKFSGRSFYHLGVSREKEKVGESSPSSAQQPVWEKVRKLKIPGSTKQFLWRALTSILLTKQTPYQRKIIQDTICPVCHWEDETISHVLWSCPTANDVWAEPQSLV